MPSLVVALLTFVFFSLIVWWQRGQVAGSHPFWQLAAERPNEAYDWFTSDPAWVVVMPSQEPPPTLDMERFVGPFRLSVPKFLGAPIVLFADRGRIDESQPRFVQTHGRSWRPRRPIVSLLVLLYPIAAMIILARQAGGAASLQTILGFGLSHLGYLLGALAIFAGRFSAFGLRSRSGTLLAALAAWFVGVLLLNV